MKSFILFFCVISFASCNQKDIKKQYVGEAQGTTYQITSYSNLNNDLSQDIDSILKGIDQSLSLYIDESTISKVNDTNIVIEVDDYFSKVFNLSKHINKVTNSAFDPTVFPLVKSWGFGPNKTPYIDTSKIDSLLQYVNYENVTFEFDENHFSESSLKRCDSITFKPIAIIKKQNPNIQLDFNAIAQGFTADVISDHLKIEGVSNYLIEIGGEVIANGTKPNNISWKVGIDKPLENSKTRELQIVLNLENRALATSGNYRQYYIKDGIKYAHTINPKNGFPVIHSLLSATVIANTCAEADAYATAFMVMGLDSSILFLNSPEGKELDAYFIFSDENGEWNTFQTKGINKLINKED